MKITIDVKDDTDFLVEHEEDEGRYGYDQLVIVIRDGDSEIRLRSRPGYTGVEDLASAFSYAAEKARKIRDTIADLPDDTDAWIHSDRSQSWFRVELEGVTIGEWPDEDVAVYELARAMSEHGSFPAAWLDPGDGPVSVDDRVRAHHDEGGTGLLPLEGVKYDEGDDVQVLGRYGWVDATVVHDYGTQIGVHVKYPETSETDVADHDDVLGGLRLHLVRDHGRADLEPPASVTESDVVEYHNAEHDARFPTTTPIDHDHEAGDG